MTSRIKIGLTLCVVGAAIGAGIYLLPRFSAKPAQAPYPPTKVALVAAEKNRAQRTFIGVGELEATQQVLLAAETSGRITRIAFEPGQAVVAGQLLVQLNDGPERAERQRLQAQVQNARQIYNRTRKLAAQNAATREQLENALAARDMALGALKHIEETIAQKAIRAPFSGTIGIRQIHEGQYLQVSQTVASLVDATRLYANFSLSEQASAALQVGQRVALRVDAYPGETFSGAITAIDPLIGRARTIQAQATLDNPQQRLKAGMYANVRVVREDTPWVVTVPETAITYTAYGDTVYVARKKAKSLVVERTAVKVAARYDGRAEVASGLQAGDRVVVSGQIKLTDGMTVEPVASNTLALSAAEHPVSGQ